MAISIHIKRAYEKPAAADGYRILVDRLWPRGVKKETLKLHEWKKELAPSGKLREWFGHKPERFAEFKKRYEKELATHTEELEELRSLAKKHPITLLYGAKDEAHNQAVVLRDVLMR